MTTPNFLSRFSIRACVALSIPFLMVGCGGYHGSADVFSQNPFGAGPAAVSLSANGGNLSASDLGSSGNYVIMAKTGISNATGSTITGHIAVSPAAATYITGFGLIRDASNQFSTSAKVVGRVYAANYSAPTPTNLTSGIGSMERSYTDAAGRTRPNFTELASGNLSGLTLAPGLYKWGTSVTIPTAVTISGSATDVWIFQISGNLSIDAGISVILGGAADPKNIFWQVAGTTTIKTNAHFEGIVLCKTAITFQSGATMNGRAYAQTRVNLDNNTITQP